MQTFTFEELDQRGKENVNAKYSKELFTPEGWMTIPLMEFERWRFTEHGERIA